jgi:hypothetical protein
MLRVACNFLEILRTLSQYKVDFIVVGGTCAVLHGAPVTTFDIDIVHSRSRDNITQLMSALEEMDAYYRGRGTQRLKPIIEHLSTAGHHLLMTKFGPLDILGSIGIGRCYDDLMKHIVVLEISGFKVYILDLLTLIEVKKETITEKDKLMISVLERTLKEKQEQ